MVAIYESRKFRIMHTVVFAMCFGLFAAVSGTPVAKPKQPNIVFILADDMGWNDVSFHGYTEIPTPNIDRLAHEGVILNSHYAQALCSPSRSALMTGKYPIRLGLQAGVLTPGTSQTLPLNEKLLPEYLKDAGYATHMVGKWHLGYAGVRMTPTFRGFESFFGYYNGYVDYYTNSMLWDPAPQYGGFDLWDNLQPVAQNYSGHYLTDVFTDKAVHKIKSHNFSTKPLFLYLSHLAPHFANTPDPIQAPSKYTDRFGHIAHTGRRTTAGMIAALDDSVGRVVDALRLQGALDNTIIVFSSDNGASGPERLIQTNPPGIQLAFTYSTNWPLRGTKNTQWEGGVRTAAFVWSKLIKGSGRVSNEIFHISDWLPTLVTLAGGTPPAAHEIDGRDIWSSVASGFPSPRQEVLIQADSVNQEYALRWHQFKWILGAWTATGNIPDGWYTPVGGVNKTFDMNTPGRLYCPPAKDSDVPCDPRQGSCLFDVQVDPCERNNIAHLYPEVEKFLSEKIRVYNATAVTPQQWLADPLADTSLHNGIMAPWL